MKLKVAFTIDSKILFQILAKALPLEDLRVEEQLHQAELDAVAKQLIQKTAKPKQITAPKRRHKPFKRVSIPFSPDRGINKIILDLLAKGPHRATEMRAHLTEGGYSPSSASSRLQELFIRGLVTKHGDGLWSLTSQSEVKDLA
jgi:DNA-binding transcriptional ArsR family regulator